MTAATLFLAGLLTALFGGACDLLVQTRQRADMAAFALGYEEAQIRFLDEAEEAPR